MEMEDLTATPRHDVFMPFSEPSLSLFASVKFIALNQVLRRASAVFLSLVTMCYLSAPTQAQILIERQFTNLNLTIPDNDPSGVVNVQSISNGTSGAVIVDVNVRVKLAGPTARNGDLYAALDHLSGYTVLLNRVGRRAENLFGYEDAGLDVIFDDEAENGDIHEYRARLFGNHETPVGESLATAWSGRWRPDARNVDPDAATVENPRRASLSSMTGLPADGRWRLYLVDVASGGVSQLQEWSLEIHATTNLNALSLELTDATIRAEQAREVVVPMTIKGDLSVSGAAGTTLSGPVSGPGQLVKSGGGTLTLSGANTFSGGVALEEGALVLGHDLAAGLGPISIKNGSLKASGGARRLDNALTLAGNVTIEKGDRFELAGAFSVRAASSMRVENETEISGDILESEPGASFIKSGNGKLTLSGANTFSGGMVLEEGTLAIGNNRALGTGPLKLKGGVASARGGPRTIANPVELAGKLQFAGADLLAFTGPIKLNADATLAVEGEMRLSGPITEEKPGAAFVKQGNGTLVLEGANTISGGVNIEEGKLLVNNLGGSGTGSGAVKVSGRAALGGKGTMAGTVALGPETTLAPGASPGALTTGSQNWDGGASFVWEINDAAGSEGHDPGWDTLRIDGRLELNPSAPFTVQIVSLGLDNRPGAAAKFDSTKDYVWRLAATAGGVVNFPQSLFRIDASRFVNALNGGKLRVEVRANDLVLVFEGVRPPLISAVRLGGGNLLHFSIQAQPNQRYQVEVSEALEPARWSVLDSVQVSASGEAEFETAVTSDRPVRFYRIVTTTEGSP